MSFIVHVNPCTASSGQRKVNSCLRCTLNSTLVLMVSATAVHKASRITRTACISFAKTCPKLHSGLRMLTIVPAHLVTPHCCAAKHRFCTLASVAANSVLEAAVELNTSEHAMQLSTAHCICMFTTVIEFKALLCTALAWVDPPTRSFITCNHAPTWSRAFTTRTSKSTLSPLRRLSSCSAEM